jgi:hypothetical protein
VYDLYLKAAHSKKNQTGIFDYDRTTREVQSVQCFTSFTRDHHWGALGNFVKSTSSKAGAIWTTMVESGELPCVALVPSTKTSDLAHAAECLARQTNFKPKELWSDTFPCVFSFWVMMLGPLLGHLRVFHWFQRIVTTLRQRHTHFAKAVRLLRGCVYIGTCPPIM